MIIQVTLMLLSGGTAGDKTALQAAAQHNLAIEANAGARSEDGQALTAGRAEGRDEQDNTGVNPGDKSEGASNNTEGAEDSIEVTSGEAGSTDEQSDVEEQRQEPAKNDVNPAPVLTQDQKNELRTLQPITQGRSEGKYVALTFDDGLDKKMVELTLDILSSNHIESTFFVIGKAITDNPELWKRAVEEGHQICNHTQTHTALAELTDEDIFEELAGWERSAGKVLGKEYLKKMKREFPYLRLPGGNGDKDLRVLRLVHEAGYTPIGWSIETISSVIKHHDYKNEPKGPIVEEIISFLTARTASRSIVLLHFNSFDTSALQGVIDGLSAKRLNCVQVQEIF